MCVYRPRRVRHTGQHQCAAAEHDAIVITPSDVRYDAMAPEDMIVVGYDGTVLETGGRDASWLPSTELPVHLAAYRRRPPMPSRSFTLSPRL